MQGGVGDCTNEIAKALARCGIETHVLTSAAGGRPSVVDESGVHIHRLVNKWDWRSLQILRRVIRETRADIVHIQYQTAAFGRHPAINLAPRLLTSHLLALPLDKGEPVGVVTTFHDLRVPYLFPKASGLREWITFELARSSDAAIATNEEDYARLGQKRSGGVSLIPIGSNIDPTPPPNYDRTAWRTHLGVTPDELLLSYFGFLNDSKGGETLIRALAEIPDAKLLMIGGQVGASDPTNAAYLARVKNLIAALGLTSRVLWTDYAPQAEVSAHFLASDLCVLPYRDGASYRRGSFMAALAHSLPIVTTSPSSPVPPSPPPEVVQSGEGEGGWRLWVRPPALRDGENVLLVPPEDPSALAEAIRHLASSADLRVCLSHGARELAQCFTWDKIAGQHLELYKSLIVR